MLHPRYMPHRWDGENITQEVPRVLQGELPYTLSRSAMLQSPHGIDHVLSNCPLTPLSYTAGNLTTAQETLVLLLKSLPLGCYFNIYGFGSEFESFYPCSCLRTGR
ncbi:unnamed protein product [Eretmochelys imbricata]